MHSGRASRRWDDFEQPDQYHGHPGSALPPRNRSRSRSRSPHHERDHRRPSSPPYGTWATQEPNTGRDIYSRLEPGQGPSRGLQINDMDQTIRGGDMDLVTDDGYDDRPEGDDQVWHFPAGAFGHGNDNAASEEQGMAPDSNGFDYLPASQYLPVKDRLQFPVQKSSDIHARLSYTDSNVNLPLAVAPSALGVKSRLSMPSSVKAEELPTPVDEPTGPVRVPERLKGRLGLTTESEAVPESAFPELLQSETLKPSGKRAKKSAGRKVAKIEDGIETPVVVETAPTSIVKPLDPAIDLRARLEQKRKEQEKNIKSEPVHQTDVVLRGRKTYLYFRPTSPEVPPEPTRPLETRPPGWRPATPPLPAKSGSEDAPSSTEHSRKKRADSVSTNASAFVRGDDDAVAPTKRLSTSNASSAAKSAMDGIPQTAARPTAEKFPHPKDQPIAGSQNKPTNGSAAKGAASSTLAVRLETTGAPPSATSNGRQAQATDVGAVVPTKTSTTKAPAKPAPAPAKPAPGQPAAAKSTPTPAPTSSREGAESPELEATPHSQKPLHVLGILAAFVGAAAILPIDKATFENAFKSMMEQAVSNVPTPTTEISSKPSVVEARPAEKAAHASQTQKAGISMQASSSRDKTVAAPQSITGTVPTSQTRVENSAPKTKPEPPVTEAEIIRRVDSAIRDNSIAVDTIALPEPAMAFVKRTYSSIRGFLHKFSDRYQVKVESDGNHYVEKKKLPPVVSTRVAPQLPPAPQSLTFPTAGLSMIPQIDDNQLQLKVIPDSIPSRCLTVWSRRSLNMDEKLFQDIASTYGTVLKITHAEGYIMILYDDLAVAIHAHNGLNQQHGGVFKVVYGKVSRHLYIKSTGGVPTQDIMMHTFLPYGLVTAWRLVVDGWLISYQYVESATAAVGYVYRTISSNFFASFCAEMDDDCQWPFGSEEEAQYLAEYGLRPSDGGRRQAAAGEPAGTQPFAVTARSVQQQLLGGLGRTITPTGSSSSLWGKPLTPSSGGADQSAFPLIKPVAPGTQQPKNSSPNQSLSPQGKKTKQASKPPGTLPKNAESRPQADAREATRPTHEAPHDTRPEQTHQRNDIPAAQRDPGGRPPARGPPGTVYASYQVGPPIPQDIWDVIGPEIQAVDQQRQAGLLPMPARGTVRRRDGDDLPPAKRHRS